MTWNVKSGTTRNCTRYSVGNFGYIRPFSIITSGTNSKNWLSKDKTNGNQVHKSTYVVGIEVGNTSYQS